MALIFIFIFTRDICPNSNQENLIRDGGIKFASFEFDVIWLIDFDDSKHIKLKNMTAYI